MDILYYLKTLLPSFKRGAVEADARQLLQLTKKQVIPSFKKLHSVMGGKPFTSPLGNEFEADVRRACGVTNSTSPVLLMNLYNGLPAKLEYIINVIDEEFEPDISKDNMTYKQMAVVRFLEYTRFNLGYSMRMGARMVTAEARSQLNRVDEIDAQLTPAEKKWFDANRKAWLQTLGLLSTPLSRLRQAIDKIPEMIIVPDTAVGDMNQAGHHRVDPLRMNLISVSSLTMNPIYHFRLFKSEIEAILFRAREKEAQVLELHILELQQAYANTQDPKLQEQIEYHTGRLQSLHQQIEDDIQSYGLA